MDPAIQDFLDEHVSELEPRYHATTHTLWEARTRSSPDSALAAARAESAYRELYTNPGDASRVTDWLQRSNGSPSPLQRRSLELLRHSYLENAVSKDELEELVRQSEAISTEFVNWRGTVEGEPVSSNDILRILAESRDEGERLQAWEASKSIGPRVAEPLRELVRHRNRVAQRLGFRDHYAMALEIQEIPEATLLALAEDLRARTEEPWRRMKTVMDEGIARRMGMEVTELGPHHFDDPFGQSGPRATGIRSHLDQLFGEVDPVALCARYFEGIGLPVDGILARSDLYERPGKDQHAFCIDMDRGGDVRVLCNVRSDERWTGIMLHELGHGVYELGYPQELPFVLRRPAHILATEAVAQFFGRLTRNPAWLGRMLDLSPDDVAQLAGPLRLERSRTMLLFARWCLVMIHFERALYADPDREDMNTLWWSLVQEFQGIAPPANVEGREDWATKNHLSMAPVYYHNYILGEMLASQLDQRIRDSILRPGEPPVETPGIGRFLGDEVFAPGGLPHWTDLIERTTGSPLGPDAFLADFATADS